MKSSLLLLVSGLTLIACGPTANFDSSENQYKSLMDGETIEVLGDEMNLSDNSLIDMGAIDQEEDPVITPEDIGISEELFEAMTCDKKEKKVYICHFPNGEQDKGHTLCIGRPALEAHLAHMASSEHDGHHDYAGPCQEPSQDENDVKNNSEDEPEDVIEDNTSEDQNSQENQNSKKGHSKKKC